ncbi:MAG: hypothetical protein PHW04_07695 [Candidatus Wallbacteria bacterium]|nr:hypothetical protein [Candidatus Wallbacteria bacterium]
MNKATVLLLAVIFLFTPVFSADSTLDTKVFTFIDHCFGYTEMLYQQKPQAEIEKTLDSLNAEADSISGAIISDLEKGDSSTYDQFVSFYNRPDIHECLEKRAPLNLIADRIIEFKKAGREQTGTLFPGYGYADSGYVYRKGEELSREVVNTFWKQIEETFEKSTRYYMMMEVSLTANFKSGTVKKVGSPVSMNVGGNIKEVVECEVTMKETIRTTCRVKYENDKVWFRLYRAAKYLGGLWIGDWEECGRTYEMKEEPTGLPVLENTTT